MVSLACIFFVGTPFLKKKSLVESREITETAKNKMSGVRTIRAPTELDIGSHLFFLKKFLQKSLVESREIETAIFICDFSNPWSNLGKSKQLFLSVISQIPGRISGNCRNS